MTTPPRRSLRRTAAPFLNLILAAAGTLPCGILLAQIDYSGINRYRDNQRRQVEGGWRPPSGGQSRLSRVDAQEEAWARKAAEQNRDEADRVQRQQDHWRQLDTQARRALDSTNYREALGLLKELQASHRDAAQSSPRVTEAIARTEAILAWSEAQTAADYRRAIAMNPGVFSEANTAFVERLEELERWQREKPEREAANAVAAARISAAIDALVAAFTAPARKVIDNSRSETRDGGFQTSRSAPRFVADDATSGEHASIRSGLGFDTAGPLEADLSSPPPPPVARPAIDPAFEKHPAVQKLQECFAKADESMRSAAAASARVADELSMNPNSGAIILLRAREIEARRRAESAEQTAMSQLREVEKTITFGTF